MKVHFKIIMLVVIISLMTSCKTKDQIQNSDKESKNNNSRKTISKIVNSSVSSNISIPSSSSSRPSNTNVSNSKSTATISTKPTGKQPSTSNTPSVPSTPSVPPVVAKKSITVKPIVLGGYCIDQIWGVKFWSMDSENSFEIPDKEIADDPDCCVASYFSDPAFNGWREIDHRLSSFESRTLSFAIIRKNPQNGQVLEVGPVLEIVIDLENEENFKNLQ